MRKPLLLILLAVPFVFFGCRKAEFEPIELQDSGSPRSDALPDAGDVFCEDPGASTCSPTACGPICHKRTGTIADTGDQCTVYYSETGPVRYDNCKKGNICLSSLNGGSVSYCFALCTNSLECRDEAGCTNRDVWSENTRVMVCDPPAQNCSSAGEPCCNPITFSGCDSGRYCYLVAPRSGSQASWTLCDYSTGETGRGDPCTASRDCYLGMACYLGSGSVGACRQVCQPLDPNACSGGGTCTPYGTQLGVCL